MSVQGSMEALGAMNGQLYMRAKNMRSQDGWDVTDNLINKVLSMPC